ncbi:MAG: aminotransferase class V-fold PLP-dependent enzyme [Acidobacteria bacterium]|nr:aminotransferase class V-fold PLP-dependent enzyme [Acidobacteriota bacterium]MBS1864465.1 aminotransferase class V-fold PLP-dependent enzyme [Acidobacteriota bacterium]
MNELLKWRSEFPILERTTYLISNSLGAMPRGVYANLKAYADSWAHRGVRAWEEGWWEMAVGVGDKVAPLIGASAGEISLHQNVTQTQAVITSCFDFRGPRNKVVMTDLEFPSIQYFYHEQRRFGARVELVPSGDPVRFDLDKFLAAIDETTLLVPISLVLFRSSFVVNAKAIVEKAHRAGARVILDVFQGTGTIPIDVRGLGVDFAVGGVLKWLCGGPGVAYLYVREDLRSKLKPALTGWIAHQRPFAFETGPIDQREDSFRYLNGTPHIPALFACQPGLEILNRVGIGAIREQSIAMTTRLVEGARARGWRVNTPENSAERAGTVSVDCPHAAEVCRELLSREILVDYRPKAGIRLSPHFYNTQDECDYALGQIEEILRTGAWAKHSSALAPA